MTAKPSKTNLKTYGGFAQACKKDFQGMNIVTDTCAIIIKACNLNEAIEKAYNYSRERYPAEKGYYNHNSDLIKV